MWPQQITISSRSPLLTSQPLLYQQSQEHKTPFCEFRAVETSTQSDIQNLTVLSKNLEQKKYVSNNIYYRDHHCSSSIIYILTHL